MSKQAEIDYVSRISSTLAVPDSEVIGYLLRKPWADAMRGSYLMDVAQILKLIPAPPGRVLDLGAGSGWTSEMLALSGYSVVGVDIAPDMIRIASGRVRKGLDLQFQVCDYEASIDLGSFDIALIYDALHHAINEGGVIRNAFSALKPGGMFISAEPGVGHSNSQDAQDAVARFGTTEKDMPYEHQRELLSAAGFSDIRQYVRLSQLPLEPVDHAEGSTQQMVHFSNLSLITQRGHTSVVVAIKGAQPPRETAGGLTDSATDHALQRGRSELGLRSLLKRAFRVRPRRSGALRKTQSSRHA